MPSPSSGGEWRQRPPCLAVDIGGTKLAAGIVEGTGEVRVFERTPTPSGPDAEVIWSALSQLVHDVLERGRSGTRPELCGIGCGGPMSAAGELVSPLNIPSWRDFPLRRRMADLTGLPTAVDNDAKALALAEGWVGAAVGQRDYISMVVSTGVGGGIVLDGRLLDGALGNAGHIGHVNVVPNGHVCGCGARGCLEAEASGSGIARITGLPPVQATPAVVARTGRMVGRAVAGVANLLDLPLATVGGSVALGFGAPFFSAAQREMRRRARLEYSKAARIVPSALGEHGGVVGGAAVAYTRL